MKHRAVTSTILAALLLWAALPSRADPPATQPAAPATQEAPCIARWIDDLADTDPAVRAAARAKLTALAADQLPALRQAVKEQAHLRPNQADAVYDVVTHVFLTGQNYAATDQGFLGVKLGSGLDGNVDHVEVMQCVQGFGAYGVLQGGDIIVSIDGVAVNNATLMEIIRQTRPGRGLTLSILRQGCAMLVAVPVVARPVALADDAQQLKFTMDRQQAAQDYWDRNFAPLLQAKQANAAQ